MPRQDSTYGVPYEGLEGAMNKRKIHRRDLMKTAGTGVAVVALVPVAGPVPPPIIVVMPL